MAGDSWSETTLGAIAFGDNGLVDGPFGSNLPASAYTATGVPVIRGGNLSLGESRFNDSEFVYVSDETAARLRRSICRPGDIVFTKKGTIGQTGFVPLCGKFDRYLLSSNQMKLSVNPEKADALFVYYVVSSPEGREKVIRDASITGVPKTNVAYLRDFPIRIPPLREQRAIAYILGTLDDKIELNRRMNETVQAMTRAIFQSWFVDFDPVRAKAEGRDSGLAKPIADLFPNRFEDSELGGIPEGWEVGHLSDVVDQLRDQENPLASPDASFRHFSIPAFDEGQWPKTELGENIKSLKSRVPPGVILLSKLNPEIERVWLVAVEATDRGVCSTEFLVLRPRSPYGRSYAYCLARSPLFRQQIEALVTGTSKSHQRAQVDALLNLAVILPPKPITDEFGMVATGLLGRTLENRRESRTLAAIRDALLPKLISGELRVKDAEQFLAEARA